MLNSKLSSITDKHCTASSRFHLPPRRHPLPCSLCSVPPRGHPCEVITLIPYPLASRERRPLGGTSRRSGGEWRARSRSFFPISLTAEKWVPPLHVPALPDSSYLLSCPCLSGLPLLLVPRGLATLSAPLTQPTPL